MELIVGRNLVVAVNAFSQPIDCFEKAFASLQLLGRKGFACGQILDLVTRLIRIASFK